MGFNMVMIKFVSNFRGAMLLRRISVGRCGTKCLVTQTAYRVLYSDLCGNW